jgi:hypothetical protein
MTSTVHVRSAEGVAPRLADALRPFLGGELPVRLRPRNLPAVRRW